MLPWVSFYVLQNSLPANQANQDLILTTFCYDELQKDEPHPIGMHSHPPPQVKEGLPPLFCFQEIERDIWERQTGRHLTHICFVFCAAHYFSAPVSSHVMGIVLPTRQWSFAMAATWLLPFPCSVLALWGPTGSTKLLFPNTPLRSPNLVPHNLHSAVPPGKVQLLIRVGCFFFTPASHQGSELSIFPLTLAGRSRMGLACIETPPSHGGAR